MSNTLPVSDRADEEIAEVAGKLSKAAKRTITNMRPEWCCSFNAQGHEYLTGRGIVEHIVGNCGRLTPLGSALRDYLRSNPA